MALDSVMPDAIVGLLRAAVGKKADGATAREPIYPLRLKAHGILIHATININKLSP
jgi:hypothetical protein